MGAMAKRPITETVSKRSCTEKDAHVEKIGEAIVTQALSSCCQFFTTTTTSTVITLPQPTVKEAAHYKYMFAYLHVSCEVTIHS